LLSGGVQAFHFDGARNKNERHTLGAQPKELLAAADGDTAGSSSRRDVLTVCTKNVISGAAVLSVGFPSPVRAGAGAGDLEALRNKVAEARRQLDPVPNLIKEEKWDSIRAILITPPLSDCWGKSSGVNPLLRNYAEAVGDQGGDELAALEAKEEALDHLRFLDMAAYNNVFNPIKTEGETGATKALIKSYYEDPVNELKASTSALDELIKLGEM